MGSQVITLSRREREKISEYLNKKQIHSKYCILHISSPVVVVLKLLRTFVFPVQGDAG